MNLEGIWGRMEGSPLGLKHGGGNVQVENEGQGGKKAYFNGI